MVKLFIRSFEDNTFIGREVDVSKVDVPSLFEEGADFTDVIRLLKKKGKGDFIFYDNYNALIMDRADDDYFIVGETQ